MSTTYAFNDGGAYEDFMGVWSRRIGDPFLDWLAPAHGLSWADIGCGNGCSTEQLCQRVAPRAIQALDPSPEQLAHAAARLKELPVTLHQGDAMALPFADASVDAALMALVIFFVPDPTRGLAEMVRVTRPGGVVAAYAWDIPAGGFPWAAVWQAQERLGIPVTRPPSAAISDLEALAGLWRVGGLEGVESRHIQAERRFSDFGSFWATYLKGPLRATFPAERLDALREETRKVLGCAETGEPITITAFASAVKGRVPG
ncbi:MAG: class I SAM-dependent methyltransferase [Roseococcus sp.]